MNLPDDVKQNPFNDPVVAHLWSVSVEGEKDLFRDKYIYPRLQEWLSEYNPGSVLDIGSGQGIVSKFFSKQEYLGVEPSEALLNLAKEKYGNKFQIGNAYDLPAQEHSFDGAISINVWFHLENLDSASKELSRILKSGGHFLIVTANPEADASWKKFYKNPKIVGKRLEGAVEIPLVTLPSNVVFFHNKYDITSNLEKYGLRILKEESFGPGAEGANLFYLIKGCKQ